MTVRASVHTPLYDLTPLFQDDRSTTINGPSKNTVFQQEASLRMSPCAPIQPTAAQMLPPAQLTIQAYHAQPQQFVPALTQAVPSTPSPYPSSLAFGAPHMVLQTAVQ